MSVAGGGQEDQLLWLSSTPLVVAAVALVRRSVAVPVPEGGEVRETQHRRMVPVPARPVQPDGMAEDRAAEVGTDWPQQRAGVISLVPNPRHPCGDRRKHRHDRVGAVVVVALLAVELMGEAVVAAGDDVGFDPGTSAVADGRDRTLPGRAARTGAATRAVVDAAAGLDDYDSVWRRNSCWSALLCVEVSCTTSRGLPSVSGVTPDQTNRTMTIALPFFLPENEEEEAPGRNDDLYSPIQTAHLGSHRQCTLRSLN
jgi:hypothetical protein